MTALSVFTIGKPPRISLNINEYTNFKLLLDSGANVSIPTTTDYAKLGNPSINKNDRVTFFASNNTILESLGSVTLELKIGSTTTPQTFYICQNVHESLLGIDGIHDFDIVIHSRGYTTKGKIKSVLHNDSCELPLLRASHNIIVEPGKVASINTSASIRGSIPPPSYTNVEVDPSTEAGLPRILAIYKGLYELDELAQTKLLVAKKTTQSRSTPR